MRPTGICERRPHGAGPHRHTATTLDAVVSSPLFEGLTVVEVAGILDRFGEAHFAPSSRLDAAGGICLITAGEAVVTGAGGRAVARLRPGDCLADPVPARLVAEAPVSALVADRDGLEELVLAEPRLGVNLLSHLIGRFRGIATSGAEAPAARL